MFQNSSFQIKKQIRRLYTSSVLGNLSLTGAWVALLASRGFSLTQIGFAETVFHITSLTFEIPSGVLADIYGRKKMLVISNLLTTLAGLVMAATSGFAGVCVSISLHAMGYNFASGSGDALAYDSLKRVGEEEKYERYAAHQSIIYRIGSGISTLCAGLALMIGYRPAYLISAAGSFLTALVTMTLWEIKPEEKNSKGVEGHIIRKVLVQIGTYFKDSFAFLAKNKKATKLMFANSFVGAMDILLLFFLQGKLPAAGISDRMLGIALFVMELGGVLGARLILKAKNVRYVTVFTICTLLVGIGILLEHTGLVLLMTAGGFISAMADDALQIRSDAKLQDMFPSGQRATLISISSFTFSVIMIVFSPLAGYFFSLW